MQIIIDISENTINSAKFGYGFGWMTLNEMAEAIKNGIIIPSNATNGDMIKAMFPNIDKYHNMLLENHSKNILFNNDWWNAPYKGVE